MIHPNKVRYRKPARNETWREREESESNGARNDNALVIPGFLLAAQACPTVYRENFACYKSYRAMKSRSDFIFYRALARALSIPENKAFTLDFTTAARLNGHGNYVGTDVDFFFVKFSVS